MWLSVGNTSAASWLTVFRATVAVARALRATISTAASEEALPHPQPEPGRAIVIHWLRVRLGAAAGTWLARWRARPHRRASAPVVAGAHSADKGSGHAGVSGRFGGYPRAVLSARNRELLGLLPAALLVTGGFTAIFIQTQSNTPHADNQPHAQPRLERVADLRRCCSSACASPPTS